MNNLYSPFTFEHLRNVQVKADWMGEAKADAPEYNPQTHSAMYDVKEKKWNLIDLKETINQQKLEENKAKLFAQMDELDMKSMRATRAVSLALVNGKTPDSADIEKLTEIEKEMKELRTKAFMVK